MKKIIALIIMICAMSTTAYAFNFPEPDWGALLAERKAMSSETDFELYAEGSVSNSVYYGARLEPKAGVYLGAVAENSEGLGPLGSYLAYIEYGDRQSDFYFDAANTIRSGNAVTMAAINTSTIDNIDYDYIRRLLDKLSSYNKPMIIRFANEMNCSNLGDEPEKYVQAFRAVANMIHEYPNFAVVWSPNDMGALDRPFEYFYPGDEYVDWVGVSCYMTRYFTNEKNTSEINAKYFMTGEYAWATNKVKPVIEFMKKNGINKPVMLSEGGVAKYNGFGDDYSGWYQPRLRNMLWNLIMKYPQIKMINYFNVNFRDSREGYYISDSSEAVKIFNEAASNGAYLYPQKSEPSFVFSPANNAGTLVSNNGIVKLYTLAYFEKQPYSTVTYKLDGKWYHSSNEIPYTCNFSLNNISDGKHTLSIEANGISKSYTLYKKNQCISFGREPDERVVSANSDISVILNGKHVSFEQPPVILNERTLVPLRAIFEAMNASVDWNGKTQTVTASRGSIKISLAINSNILYKNGSPVTLDVPAQLVNDYTMVPARAVAEAFGANVSWDGETKSVVITE